MAICDAVVFPYLEVGQSSSGPISQALELGCRVIASRTHTFFQFGRYHQNMIEFFDIGNHLELAGRILARPQFERRDASPGIQCRDQQGGLSRRQWHPAERIAGVEVSTRTLQIARDNRSLRTYDRRS